MRSGYGDQHRVGCTTISILLANTLAHEGKRAAIVELDDADGCFEQLCRQEREEEQVDGITKFAIGTLDYYYHVPLQKFQLDYKPYMILLSMILGVWTRKRSFMCMRGCKTASL